VRHRLLIPLCLALSTLLVAPGVARAEKLVGQKNSTAIPGGLGSPESGKKRYIVRFDDAVVDPESIITATSGKSVRRLSKVFNGTIADLSSRQVASLKKLPTVLYVEEDLPIKTNTTINPTPSWGLDRINQRALPLDSTYSFASNGSGVDAYVVDTGILLTHTEFAGRVRAGFDAFSGTGNDCNGHGTHVAGTVAGATHGVAPGASLIALRILDCAGSGNTSGLVSAIDWAIEDHTTTPAVMNLSLGGARSPSVNSAVDRAFADGITVVVAAGNTNVDACTLSPASATTSALTVGATTITDARASFSNFGQCLDLFAPGASIKSAWYSSDTATNTLSGTSMASPHVAGLVARYLSTNRQATPTQVMNAINGAATTNVVTNPGTLSPNRLAFAEPSTSSSDTQAPVSGSPTATTTPTSGGAGSSGTSSSGPAPAIPAPLSIVALPGLQSARLTWTDSQTDEFPHTAHIVRVYRAGKLFTQVTVSNNNTHQVPRLRAGSSHYFTVAAINAGGVSPFSLPSNVIIPVKKTGGYTATNRAGLTDESSVPAAPTSLRTARFRSTAIVRWTPPTNMRATSYEVLFRRGGKVMTQVVTNYSGGIKIFGLKKGLYSVRVRALNEAGAGRLSAAKRVRL
jgi:subtilisin family serine protease